MFVAHYFEPKNKRHIDIMETFFWRWLKQFARINRVNCSIYIHADINTNMLLSSLTLKKAIQERMTILHNASLYLNGPCKREINLFTLERRLKIMQIYYKLSKSYKRNGASKPQVIIFNNIFVIQSVPYDYEENKTNCCCYMPFAKG